MVVSASALAACKQEAHATHPRPARPALALGVGGAGGAPESALDFGPLVNPYADNGYGMSEGNRLYDAFNCSGCHAHGGGGIGPALMDARWLYGGDPRSIFVSIAAGRPDGMPTFGRRLTSDQVWQLVAHVRSLSGLAPTAEAPGRTDDLSVRSPPNRLPPVQPWPAEKSPSQEGATP